MLSLLKRTMALLVSYRTSWGKWGKRLQSDVQLGSCRWCGFISVTIKLCSALGREQQGLCTVGSCREILNLRGLHAEQCVCWNFEIWACLKLKLESKPPGRKQRELFFFFFQTLETKSTFCSQLHIKSTRWALKSLLTKHQFRFSDLLLHPNTGVWLELCHLFVVLDSH